MKNNMERQSVSWLDSVAIELHGHRKKLDFIVRSIRDYCNTFNYGPTQVNILEIGCSNGRNISLPLAELGFNVRGIDLHAPSIAWAKAHNTYQNASFVCQDFSTFSKNDKFSVVILSDILEHIENPLNFMHLAVAHLKKNGIVLICIPNGYGPYEIEQRFLRITRLGNLLNLIKLRVKKLNKNFKTKETAYNHDSGHIQFFRMADIYQLACDAGLGIDEKANGALFGGDVTYTLGVLFPFIVKFSLRLADHLPHWMVTTWYFRLIAIEKAHMDLTK